MIKTETNIFKEAFDYAYDFMKSIKDFGEIDISRIKYHVLLNFIKAKNLVIYDDKFKKELLFYIEKGCESALN